MCLTLLGLHSDSFMSYSFSLCWDAAAFWHWSLGVSNFIGQSLYLDLFIHLFITFSQCLPCRRFLQWYSSPLLFHMLRINICILFSEKQYPYENMCPSVNLYCYIISYVHAGAKCVTHLQNTSKSPFIFVLTVNTVSSYSVCKC